MITACPTTLAAAGSPPRPARPSAPAVVDGSWRYRVGPTPRAIVVTAALLSAGLHLGVLFGIGPAKKKPVVVRPDTTPVIRLAMPDLKELEEPEPVDSTEPTNATDMATLVPMQADLPQISRPSDFVQQVNFTSLIEKPDFSNVNLNVIPETYRGGRQLAESIGKIFNLSDLDRVPEPLVQPAPLYPAALKREGTTGTVKVGFIVDTDGRVLDARPVESTNVGFDEAAVMAVSKWRFRPGIRAGRKVNTRMVVPVVFILHDLAP